MSFARGFSSGFGSMLDARRLAMQEQEAQRIRERDEKRDALAEQETFGFYQDEQGQRFSQEDAFIVSEDGTKTLKEGLSYTPGSAQLRGEQVKQLQFVNSPEYRALGMRDLEANVSNNENLVVSNRLGLNKKLTTEGGAALIGFWSEFDPIVQDPNWWNNASQVKKDLFIRTVASQAHAINETYGFNPLDILLDDNIEGYQVGAQLQNMISKNPDIIQNLDLNAYGSSLNSLFNLQTKKYVGKQFKGEGVEGVVKNVSLSFDDYKIDPNSNTVILSADYEVETADGETKTVRGVLNDTNREVINPNLPQVDELALSLNDLIDYTSAGASMLGFLADPNLKEVFLAGKESAKKQASMFPQADYGEFKKLEAQAEDRFAREPSRINNDFKNAGIDLDYNDLYATRGNFRVADEVELVNTIISSLPYASRLLEETSAEGYEDSNGYRIKRDEEGNLPPLWELKTYGMKSYAEIEAEIMDGSGNIFADEPVVKINYSFPQLDIDLSTDMTLGQAEEELNKIAPSLYNNIVKTLEAGNRPVTISEVLSLANSLQQAGKLPN